MARIGIVEDRRLPEGIDARRRIVEGLRIRGVKTLLVREEPLPQNEEVGSMIGEADKILLVSKEWLQSLEALDDPAKLEEILSRWKGIIILEGFRGMEAPKIVIIDGGEGVEMEGVKGPVIAVLTPEALMDDVRSLWPGVEIFTLDQIDALIEYAKERLLRDLVEELPGRYRRCTFCGFYNCERFLEAFKRGEVEWGDCVYFRGGVEMWVNGKRIELTGYPVKVLKAVIGSLAKTLTEEEIKTLELEMRWD